MTGLKSIEIHCTFFGEIILQYTGGECHVYNEKDYELTDEIYRMIESRYPEAMAALRLIYKSSQTNVPFFKYKIASRFIRCNFGGYDGRLDFEETGKMNFELVACPLRKECQHENVVCRPKHASPLTSREYEIMKYLCSGESIADIAARLNITEATCKKHKQNAMGKLKCNTLIQFKTFADSHNLFGHL